MNPSHIANTRPGALGPVRTALVGVCAGLLVPAVAVAADYRDDIGYVSLATELGATTPLGLGVPVTHVEAAVQIGLDQAWMPDIGNAEFAGKAIIDNSGGTPGLYSGHSTSVGQFFYGDSSSIATGIASIAVYEANGWLGNAFLRTPTSGNGYQPLASDSRVANHSWIGTTTSGSVSYDPAMLRRLDWVVSRDELVTVVGLNNGVNNYALLSSSFNAIAVGRSDGGHASGTAAVGVAPYDTVFYTAGRVKPDLVAPAVTTSLATPMVSAAAALLVQVGHDNAALSTDPVAQSTTNRAGGLIRNAERAEVIKVALMAGALRSTSGNVAAPDITDYRATAGNQTTNGLDRRFGAGQLNVANSYHIVAAGEKNSLQDYSAGGGQAGLRGFDYDPRFGGASGTNDLATYNFPVQAKDAQLSFSLAWNLKIHGGTVNNFNSTPYFYNLDVLLYDVTNSSNPVLVASSASTTENTENLSVVLSAGRSYSVQVKRPATQATFDWDYGAAWQIAPQGADADGDGVPDSLDNCSSHANTNQVDADNDGFGNRCDADLNNNGSVNSQDYTIFRTLLGTSDPIADLNSNGVVNSQDTAIFRSLLGYPPGPSGLVP